MRTLFLCLFSILLQAIAFGQGCDPNSCPNITCAAGVSPVCTESGYWVCGCTTSGDSTCYSASDCGSENYSCVDGCCVDNVGCTVGVCLSRADCGSNTSAWACSDGCCESTACTVGGSCGVCGGALFTRVARAATRRARLAAAAAPLSAMVPATTRAANAFSAWAVAAASAARCSATLPATIPAPGALRATAVTQTPASATGAPTGLTATTWMESSSTSAARASR